MALIPQASCPKCRGPITFWDVLGILTPFQSISCPTCGESVFLKHPWQMAMFCWLVGVIVLLGALKLVMMESLPQLAVYLGAIVLIVVMELIVTVIVVKKQDLVVRQET